MSEYSLAHIGVNAAHEEEARKAAGLFAALFGFAVKEGSSSVFSGPIELMKSP